MQEIRQLVEQTCNAIGLTQDDATPASGPTLRYELFHSDKSLCSQKVRAVLAHHAIPFVDREIDVMQGHNFVPSCVRLRLMGCKRIGTGLVSTHTGSTSVETAGCDPCVVPTLIDWQDNVVRVDSKRICLDLDQPFSEEEKLVPAALSDAVMQELAMVDDMPNIQMLMSKAPGDVDTNVTKLGLGNELYTGSRLHFCEQFLKQTQDDPQLVEAYGAKMEKERSAAAALFTPDAVKHAYDIAEKACRRLEEMLQKQASRWLFGERLTMADLFWGLELLRLDNLGTASFWTDNRLPQLERYFNELRALPAIKTATQGEALF